MTDKNNYGLSALMKRKDGDSTNKAVVEILDQRNDILNDIRMQVASNEMEDRVLVRTVMPTTYEARINKGTPSSRADASIIAQPIGSVETLQSIDTRLIDKYGGGPAYEADKKTYIESLMQEVASSLFYGTKANSKFGFDGLAARLSSLDDATVMSCGAVAGADVLVTSAFFVDWGPQVYGTYGKGTKHGLNVGKSMRVMETYEDDNGTLLTLETQKTKFTHDLGLTVIDSLRIGRLCNIDVSLGEEGGFKTNLGIEVLGAMKNRTSAGLRMYVSKTLYTKLIVLANNDQNRNVGWSQVYGDKNTMRDLEFFGVKVRECEAILDTEEVVS